MPLELVALGGGGRWPSASPVLWGSAALAGEGVVLTFRVRVCAPQRPVSARGIVKELQEGDLPW